MKTAISTLVVTMYLLLAACGGGSSSSDGGGDSTEGATIPQNISGSYSGTWEGSGVGVAGVFTCEGTFNLNISQSGSTITVAFSVVSSSGSGTGQCVQAFNFSGNGTYNATTGEVAILSVNGGITVSVNGVASEQGGIITLSGAWSTTATNSANVIASGTWSAVSQ